MGMAYASKPLSLRQTNGGDFMNSQENNQNSVLTPVEELWLKVIGAHSEPGDIPSEFDERKPCDILYSNMTDARLRLCERTGIDFEDHDLLEIIESLERIGKLCALRMYDYGTKA